MRFKIFTQATLFVLFFLNAGLLTAQEPFVLTINTNLVNYHSTGPTEFEIPINGFFTYNYDVDWDNDGIFDNLGVTGDITHDYGTPGIYTIRIRGVFPAIFFDDSGDEDKVLSVDQWGDIEWLSFYSAFEGAGNLVSVGSDAPDLSQVTDMSYMFRYATVFNSDIGHWDVSNVEDMENLFDEAHAFNQDIGGWDVSRVTDMESMFEDAYVFNQDIGNWNVSSVTDMEDMFQDAKSFNQDIGGWNVSNVTSMEDMFEGAVVFNQDIGNWDVSSVTDMSDMFKEAYCFNQDIGGWDVSNVIDMNDMFEDAYAFNQDIGGWDVSNVEDMASMFEDARSFNQDIGGWDVSSVYDMYNMFEGAIVFNQDIGNWNVSMVEDMDDMFKEASAFNQDIGNWDVSNVAYMYSMFEDATSFNQDLSQWDVSYVMVMSYMFYGATAFDQNLGNWDLSSMDYYGEMYEMLDNSGLSIENYDATLLGWANNPNTPDDVDLGALGMQYCAVGARTILVVDKNWNIMGDAPGDCFAGGTNENIGAAPNCSNFSPAINEKGQAVVSATDFITNISSVESSPTITVYNEWGGVLPGYPRTFVARDDDFNWDVCDYLGKTLNFSVSNGAGICNEGYINLDGAPGIAMTSAFGNQKPWFEDNATDGKLNVYCGMVPDPSEHVPSATTACGGSASVPTVQPDWVMTVPCNEVNDTAEVIFRTWESYDKEGNLSTLTDTIVVFRLPKLTPGAFVDASEQEFSCKIETIPNNGEALKRYVAWKQAVGIHDYERPYSKLGGVVYFLPFTVVEAGLDHAWNQGENIFLEYLNCPILKKADGKVWTLGEIVTGAYGDYVYNNATEEQKRYGELHNILDGNYPPEQWSYGNGAFQIEYYPFLLLEEGDLILSEGGSFAQVGSEWFYNGHGNSPFGFAGGWPSIYGSGECVSFCDVGHGQDFGCIKVRVPRLSIEGGIGGGFDNGEEEDEDGCQIICLPTGVHCGITIKQDAAADWTGSCPQTRGVDSWITQTCWAETENICDEFSDADCEEWTSGLLEEEQANNTISDLVADYECSDKAVKIHLSQWQSLVDEIGPIFDFCYPLNAYLGGVSGPDGADGPVGPTGPGIDSPNDPGSDFPGNSNGGPVLELPTYNVGSFKSAIRKGVQHEVAYDWEKNNPTVFTMGTHDCAAEVFVPDVKVIDNCSGIHAVKVMVDVQGGTRAVAMELTHTEIKVLEDGDTCTVYTYSHTVDPITVPFNGCEDELTEVRYEAADNCWNQSTWSKFIKIRDDVPPTVVVNRNLNVTLSDKIAWAKSESWDEGSWDNCAIDLRLGRRSDWWTGEAMVDLCADLGPNAPYDNWVDLLDDLGVKRTQAVTAVGGGTVGAVAFNNAYNVNDLKTFLNDGEVEAYYFHQIQWLWEDEELCGEKVVHAWIYSIAEYLAENCSAEDEHGNPLNVRDLEAIFDNLTGASGYGNELALMGGGWSKSVPFKCADACEAVPVELLVLDYCCNWGIGRSTMNVEDAGNSKLVTRLPDLDISCESYNLFYKDAVESAAVFGENGSGADTIGAFADVDEALGAYILTWVDNQNRPTDIEGNLLSNSELNFTYKNVSCSEKSATEQVAIENHDGTIGWEIIIRSTTFLDTTPSTAQNGVIAINCSGTLTQDIWVDLDECGQGTITRRFFISGGCDDDIAPEWEFHQVINVQSACGMRASMFDLPANVGSKNAPICLPQGLSQSYLPDTIGALAVKSHLEGKLCNSFATGSDVKEFDVAGTNMKKYIIEWTMIDWCAHHTSTNREFSYTQEVIATINPDCDVTTGTGDDTTDVSLVQGTIATERGDAVQKVEMKAVLGSGSPLTTVTGGEGAYNFSINYGSQVSLIPSKNTGFANGVSTQDLIAIQRHVLQKKALDSKYQRIAADVDGNGSINGFDVLELRRLVMQPHTKFANNTSWRFFDKQTDKEVYDVANVNGDMNVDFVGVKIGDVNLSGDPRRGVASSARSSRSITGTLNLNMADKAMKGGEIYRIDVTSDNFANINGMQYTLAYVTNLVEIESIEAGALNITKDNYVRYAPGVITSSWSEADGQNLSSNEVLFTLVVKAKSEGRLRDALSLNNRVTTTEAYDAEGGLQDVSLRFDGQTSNFALYQNTPNPYAGETVIGFHLPEASEAVMTIYDVTGRLIKRINGEYEAGYNEVRLTSTDLGVTGVLYYQLDTKTYTATKKMIVIE